MKNPTPCQRSDGSLRAHFRTKEEAEHFREQPENRLIYAGDVPHLCDRCSWIHLSRPEWLFPEWLAPERMMVN
jgi:hypothetical protein